MGSNILCCGQASRSRTSIVGPDDECGGLSAESPCNLTSEWTEWSDCNCDFIYRYVTRTNRKSTSDGMR